jgi:hypothetical protein
LADWLSDWLISDWLIMLSDWLISSRLVFQPIRKHNQPKIVTEACLLLKYKSGGNQPIRKHKISTNTIALKAKFVAVLS